MLHQPLRDRNNSTQGKYQRETKQGREREINKQVRRKETKFKHNH